MAAERFVALCRTAIKPALFLIFANSEAFARNFVADVEKQHKGLLSHVELPLPSNTDKETAVRTNINRLNPISYWYCLDRAGPASKVEVYNAIKGQATFPDCFLSVDKAIAESSRMGRDANTCILSLVVFIDADTLPPSKSAGFGAMINKLSFETEHVRVERFSSGWAQPLIADTRRAKMLESEWSLRIVTLSNRVADALLSAAHDDEVRELLDLALEAHSVGTQHQTLAGHAAALQAAAEALPEVLDRSRIERFWAKGQLRATDYEGALRRLYADYNKSSKGFLAYRPDLVIEPYGVCSVLNAADGSADGLNDAIKRRAHAVEFTASKEYDANKIRAYLEQKLMNYVHVVETQ
jgi:hypothetical protein